MTTAIKININDGRTRNVMTGGETTADFDFPIYDDDHINVYKTDVNGAISLLTKDTHYTVPAASVDAQAGGVINLVTAAVAGEVYTLYQAIPYERTSDFNQAGDFFAEVLNKELDLITQQIQQLVRDQARTLLAPVDTEIESFSLPAPEDGKLLAWDGVLGALKNSTGVTATNVTPTNSSKSREIADLFDVLNPQRNFALGSRGAEQYVPRPYTAIGSSIETIISETEDNLHRHFGQVIRLSNGKLLFVYRRAVTHGVEGEGVIVGKISSGDGALNGDEFIIAQEVGYDLRGVHGCITPTGRVLITYSKIDPDDQTDVSFVAQYSDDFGIAGSWSDPYVTFTPPIETVTFARAFGRMKIKPADNDLGFEIYYSPYYQTSTSPVEYGIPLRVSSDNGLTFTTRGFIDNDSSGDNETDVVFLDALNGLAISRASALVVKKTADGGENWTYVGDVSNTNSNSVAPNIDIVPHPLTGKETAVITYCNRSNDNLSIKWKPARELFTDTTFNTANGYTNGTQVIENTLSWENASGYVGTIWYDNRILATLAFKEYSGATITGITQANPAVVTTSAAHNFNNGDKIYIENVVGMTEVNDVEFTIANVTSTTFELSGVDSSAYTAYSSAGNARKRGSDVVWVTYDWAELVVPFAIDTTNNVTEHNGKMVINGNFYNPAELEVYEDDDNAKAGVRVEGDNVPIMGQKRENSDTWQDAEYRSWLDSAGNWFFQDTENAREIMRALFSDGSISFPNGLRPNGALGNVLSNFVNATEITDLKIVGSSTDGTYGYTQQDGYYFEIGNLVVVLGRVLLNAITVAATGSIEITSPSIPTCKNDSASRGFFVPFGANNITLGNGLLSGYMQENTKRIRLLDGNANGFGSTVAPADLASNSSVYFGCVYFK